MADDMTGSELERLRAENERLKRAASRGITIKVSEKGGVSVYELGRFPVTLYQEQWMKLLRFSAVDGRQHDIALQVVTSRDI